MKERYNRIYIGTMLKKVSNHPLFYAFIVLLFGIVGAFDFTKPGVFVGHDTQDHVVRIAQFYVSLEEGNFIPRWSSNLNWGYGHPVMMFLYPLTSYIASLFISIGFSYEDATEIVFAIGYIGSGLSMWWWVREWVRDRRNNLHAKQAELAGVAAGVLYMYAPYRFVDLYVRGAIGENFFFIWPSLVLYFLLKIGKSQGHKEGSRYRGVKYVAGGAVSICAMLLSHNALSIMYLPFIGLYGIYVIYETYKTNGTYEISAYVFMKMVAMGLLGIGLSAFFLIPAFIEGKYTLRDIVTEGITLSRFETLSRIWYSPWSFGGTGEMSVQLGIVGWTLVIVGIVVLGLLIVRKPKSPVSSRHLFMLLTSSLVMLPISIALMLPSAEPIYTHITIFQKFQFPWRFLSLALFSPALIGGVIMYLLPRKYIVSVAVIIVVACLYTTSDYRYAKEHTKRNSQFYRSIYEGTTDTGESSPIWSVRFMEQRPAGNTQVIEGVATIVETHRTSTERDYRVTVLSDQARLLENTLYFPGWNVYRAGYQVPLADIVWQDPNYRGLITFFVPRGTYDIRIVFENTRVRTIAEYISLVSFSALIVLMLGVIRERRHEEN